MRILVLNGPNLNKLGQRDADQYGADTLKEVQEYVKRQFPDCTFTFLQSNKEGELIEAIQGAEDDFDGLVANFGGFSHTSVAIRDSLELLDIPVIEVHISNIHAREAFRQHSTTGAVANGVITGLGKDSYVLGVYAIQASVSKNKG